MLSSLKKIRKKSYIAKLVSKGLKLGSNVYLNDGFFIDPAHCHLITIEDNVVFGPNVSCIAHDASTLKVIGKTLIAEVKICKNAFIGARTIILPGVTVGENSIIGAGSVLTKNIPSDEVWAGVPAKYLSDISNYRKNLLSKNADDFLYEEYKQENLSKEKIQRQLDSIKKNGIAFMKS